MRVIKWEPFRDVDDVFDRFFAESMRRWPRASSATQQPREWAPAADVSETDGEYVIKAALPEVRKEDVSITVQDGVLTLAGERKQEKEEKGGRFHRIERQYGTFVRRFTLPSQVDEAKVLAEFKDGVLNITLPKVMAAVVKPVEVKVA